MKIPSLVALALLGASLAANGETVTYDFTGVVTAASGIYASAAATVSGTFTFDIAAGNASQSVLPVNFTSAWASQAWGGPHFYGGPVPSALVFGSSVESGGVDYSNSRPRTLGSYSEVNAGPSLGTVPNTYYALDDEWVSPSHEITSLITLTGGIRADAPFDANGLPVFANAMSATGELEAVTFDGSDTRALETSLLDYKITSLFLAVPEIDPASAAGGVTLLLSGLAMTLGARRSRNPGRHGS